MTFCDVFMSSEERDGNCHRFYDIECRKVSQDVARCRKVSYIVATCLALGFAKDEVGALGQAT